MSNSNTVTFLLNSKTATTLSMVSISNNIGSYGVSIYEDAVITN